MPSKRRSTQSLSGNIPKPRRVGRGVRSNRATGSDTKLVPYNVNVIKTDRLKLSPEVDIIYRCRRTYQASTITQVVGASFGAVTPTLSSVTDVANLQGVFDQYRITKIEINFKVSLNPANTAAAGEFVTCLDFDDAVALGSTAAALDYSNAVVSSVTQQTHRRCFVPRVSPAIWASAAFSGYGSAKDMWLNSASSSIQFYGVKYALDAYASAGAAVSIVPYVTLEIELRASR